MRNKLKRINSILSEKYAVKFKHKPHIMCFLLHKIYPQKSDIHYSNGTTVEGVTMDKFEEFIRYFAQRNFIFLTDKEVESKELDKSKKYIYVSFDDGYFNNTYALKVLEKYNAKATFYISTNHIKEKKYYWWDVIFKERMKQGNSPSEIEEEFKSCYKLNYIEIEEKLKKEFGEDCLNAKNDLMRPMTENELIQFAKHPSVTIGNHTDNHQNLSNYGKDEIEKFIVNAQNYLRDTLGIEACSIAYPYGMYNDDTLQVCKELGLNMGVTIAPGKNYYSNMNYLEINRFLLNGFEYMPELCSKAYVDFSFIDFK